MHKKEVTIYDIAAEMNISAATVSRALNNNKSLNGETIKKVVQCAEKMGYRSNRFASNLRRQRTQTIGIIVPRLDSSFMSACLAGMEEVANQEGYNVIISQSFEQVEKEAKNAKTMFDSRVDGIIVSLAANTREINHFKPFLDKGIPVVFFDRVPPYSENVTFVIDNFEAARMVTNHLVEQGCTYLAHITLEQKASVYVEREKGFFAAISENVGVGQLVLRGTDLSIETGIEMANRLIRQNHLPEGVFVANDLAAVGLIIGLQNFGIKIPEQIAVAGFNNDPISRVVKPNLSTVDYPGREAGRQTARCLIDHLEGRGSIVMAAPVILNSNLVIRESSKRKL
jgi:LacI family transcriptional regulator